MIQLLAGIRILEVGSVVLGPYAGQTLADLGATVIKVEPPEGDIARATQPQGDGDGALFVNNNRNKRSIAIDLKDRRGKAALDRLIAASDVLIHNMRADAATRLGLGFDDVARINPQIVHCSGLGFGQRGRYRDRPAFDDIIQAASGVAGLAIAAGAAPAFVPTILADKVTALHIVHAVLAALLAKARGRAGAIEIEVPMFETMAAFLLNEHLAAATFADDGRTGYPRVLAADRRPYATADGWIAVMPYTGSQWQRFLTEIGRGEICAEPWFADARSRQLRIDDLYTIVAAALGQRTTAEWIAALGRLDLPCSPVATLDDLLVDPHLADIGFFDPDPAYSPTIRRAVPQPVHFPGVESGSDVAARALGADSRVILRESGYDDAAIDALVAAGVVRTAG